MGDVQTVRLNAQQAKSIAEIAGEGEATVRAHQAWSAPSFLEVVCGKSFSGGPTYIVDSLGGYHRLPNREKRGGDDG